MECWWILCQVIPVCAIWLAPVVSSLLHGFQPWSSPATICQLANYNSLWIHPYLARPGHTWTSWTYLYLAYTCISKLKIQLFEEQISSANLTSIANRSLGSVRRLRSIQPQSHKITQSIRKSHCHSWSVKVEHLRVGLIFMLAVKQWVHPNQLYLRIRATGGLSRSENVWEFRIFYTPANPMVD